MTDILRTDGYSFPRQGGEDLAQASIILTGHDRTSDTARFQRLSQTEDVMGNPSCPRQIPLFLI